jgi:hypothetical protein
MTREDDMRPVAPAPLAPAKPPAVAVAPIPRVQPAPRAPAAPPRPPVATAPQPRPQIAQAAQSNVPRPPGSIGAQPSRPQPHPTANLFRVDGFILDNLNRR